MKTPVCSIFVAAWIAFGVLGYGMTLGYFQNKYPSVRNTFAGTDTVFAVAVGLTGPIGFVVAFVSSDGTRYGFRWVPTRQVETKL